MFKLSIARAKVSKVLRAGLIRDDSHFAYDAGLDDPCLDDHGDCAAPALDQSKIHQDENDDTQSQQVRDCQRDSLPVAQSGRTYLV